MVPTKSRSMFLTSNQPPAPRRGRSLRNRVIFLFLIPAALFMSPPALLTALIFAGIQQMQMKRSGRGYLWPAAARTVARFGRAMYPDVDGEVFAAQVDRYLCSFESPRKWRLLWALVLLDVAPCLEWKLPFSWLSESERREFCESSMTKSSGMQGVFSRTKQLIRMGRYGSTAGRRRQGVRRGAASVGGNVVTNVTLPGVLA